MTGRELDRIEVPGKVLAVRFAADGKTPQTLVVSDRQGRVSLWDVATGEVRATLSDSADAKVLEFSPDGQTIAGVVHGSVFLWDAHAGHLRLVVHGHQGSIEYLAFRPDGRALAAAGSSGFVSLWAVPSR